MTESNNNSSRIDDSSHIVQCLYPHIDMEQAVDWFALQLTDRLSNQRYDYLLNLCSLAFSEPASDPMRSQFITIFLKMVDTIEDSPQRVRELLRLALKAEVGSDASASVFERFEALFSDASFIDNDWPRFFPGVSIRDHKEGIEFDPDQYHSPFQHLLFITMSWLFDLVVVEHALRRAFHNTQQWLAQVHPDQRPDLLIAMDHYYESSFSDYFPDKKMPPSMNTQNVAVDIGELFTLMHDNLREDSPRYQDMLLSIARYDTCHIRQMFQHSLDRLDPLGNDTLKQILKTIEPFADLPRGGVVANSCVIDRVYATLLLALADDAFDRYVPSDFLPEASEKPKEKTKRRIPPLSWLSDLKGGK